MSEKMKDRPNLLGIYIMLTVLILCVIAGISFGYFAWTNHKNVMAEVDGKLAKIDETLIENNEKEAAAEEKGEKTQENDVTIAEQYVIRSTEHISDAYKTGDSSGLNDKDIETLDMASKVLEEIITSGMDDFEKEKAVYDWMTHELQNDNGLLTVIPTTQADSDNPYGVLKYHNAICVGYATTFRLFMQMLDIPCMVVHNTELFHSWDLVQLDGNWYHTDIYADSGTGSYYSFNLTDIMRSREQNWDSTFYPAAKSLEYNIAYQSAQEATDVYDLPQQLRAAIDEGESILALKFDASLTEYDAKIALGMIEQIQSLIWNVPEYAEVYFNHSWNPTEDGYLLAVYIQDNSETSIIIEDEDQERVSNVIDEAFGDFGFDDSYSWESDGNYEEWEDDYSEREAA